MTTTAKGYCMGKNCHMEQDMMDAVEVKMKNGRPAIKGTCSVCGTSMYRIGRLK